MLNLLGSKRFCEILPQFFSLNVSTPSQNNDIQHFFRTCELLRELGLCAKREENRGFTLTNEGTAAGNIVFYSYFAIFFYSHTPLPQKKTVQMCGTESISLFMGFALSRYFPRLQKKIKNQKDFLFVTSHFLSKWRREGPSGPKIQSKYENEDLFNLMQEIIETFCDVVRRMGGMRVEIPNTAKITSFYLRLDAKEFGGGRGGGGGGNLVSLCDHFCGKLGRVTWMLGQWKGMEEGMGGLKKFASSHLC